VPLKAERTEDDQARFVIETEVRYDGQPVEVRVVFSPEHPFVPPKVYGPPGCLPRHQQPIAGNFCIVDNEENWWRPNYPASWLVAKLQELLDATAAGPDAVASGEADMPEPLTGHFHGRDDRIVLVPDQMLADDLGAKGGRFVLAAVEPHQLVLTQLDDDQDRKLTEIDPALGERVGVSNQTTTITGDWIELDDLPDARDWDRVLEAAAQAAATGSGSTISRPRKGQRKRRRERSGGTNWVGVTFWEEGPVRQQPRRAWLFEEVGRTRAGSPYVVGSFPVESQALSQAVRLQRIPELRGLGEKSFLVVGAGALGGPLALELAKAGCGRIEIVDFDNYDLNNAVRHQLPISAAGRNKAVAVAEAAEQLDPFVSARGHDLNVGLGDEQRRRLDRLVAAADVVVDASGSYAVTRLLQRRTAEHGARLVTTAMTPGGYGGRVLTLGAEQPCFDCFLLAQDDGSIPRPPEGQTSNVTPYGCSHPAASCAGFDAAEMVAIAARAAVQASEIADYPSSQADWIVVRFRDYSDAAPRWQEGKLAIHPDCPYCS
jgi:molybdopterin/thiamine biosynthesis adenylyltransferase